MYVHCTAACTNIVTNDELVTKLLVFKFKALSQNFIFQVSTEQKVRCNLPPGRT
jgi:hypothetical protein